MNSSGIQIRRLREVTAGTPEGGAMTIVPFATFKMQSALTRTPGSNVNADRQQRDNPATDFSAQASATSDYLLDVYDLIREEAFCSVHTSSLAVTANTTIAAVVSGNKLTKTGTWPFAVGDFVLVSGLVTNPAVFVARVTSNSTTDLGLDTPHGALLAEAAGPSVTVKHIGQLALGTSLLTASYEMWNINSSKGKTMYGLGCSSWGIGFDHPGHFTQDFAFRGMQKAVRIGAQLANTSADSVTRRVVNSNIDFGDAGNPGAGMGLDYGGTLLTDLIISKLKLSVENPLQTIGGAGVLGPRKIAVDSDFTVKLDLSVIRTGSDVDDLEDDANDPNAERAIGFGVRDADGHRAYIYLPRAQALNGDSDGLKKQGSEMAELSFLCAADSVLGCIRYARLGP